MPLPASNTPWPPKEWAPIFEDMRRWDAWWTGDPAALRDVYTLPRVTRPQTSRHKNRGFFSKFFWGRQPATLEHNQERSDVHVPMATDLCATSADLLYATPPKISVKSETTNQQIERYRDDGLFEQLLTGAETGAALGGRYHRVTWDQSISSRPFLTTVDADSALPEFRWGRLVAVTFWSVIRIEGGTYWRHLERHELDANGNGIVRHGLYEGATDNLGTMRPLTDDAATLPLAGSVVEDTISDGITPGLNVVYIPNITPQRRWRKQPNGMNLGRSDLDGGGIESLMDALDETYNSWMRDIRLGKARVFADRNMLETTTGGATFDLDQEIFTPLDGLSGSMQNALPIQAQEFNIRVQEHADTATDLVHHIIRAARYSASTFGYEANDAQVTATEVRARQSATNSTRNRKIRLEKPALQTLIVKLIRTDQAVFNTPGLDPEDMSVDFPPLSQETTESNATTVATLKGAGVLSMQTAVELAHPDWDATQIKQEVGRIQSEAPLASPDQWRPDGG